MLPQNSPPTHPVVMLPKEFLEPLQLRNLDELNIY